MSATRRMPHAVIPFRAAPPGRCAWRAVIAGLALLLTLAAHAERYIYVDAHGNRLEVDTAVPGYWPATPKAAVEHVTDTRIGFEIVYRDVIEGTRRGFDDPSRGAARRALVTEVLRYVDEVLNEDGAVRIEFDESLLSGSGYLAAASAFFRPVPGYRNGAAFQHITTGEPKDPNLPDMLIRVNFGHTWNETLATPTTSQYDLFSVLLHEVGHGLGILSLAIDEDAESRIAPGVYSVWDWLMETGNGNTCWDEMQPVFVGLPQYLLGQDNGVLLIGAAALTVHGQGPRVYAPNPFRQGSSLSHFAPSLSGDAVMQPSIPRGRARRAYLPVEKATLYDLGYTNIELGVELPEDLGPEPGPKPAPIPWANPESLPAFRVPFFQHED